MCAALTTKSQVTIPKDMRLFLGVGPGEHVKFEALSDGRVAIASVHPRKRGASSDPFERMKGSGKRGISTEKIMCATRGDDWKK